MAPESNNSALWRNLLAAAEQTKEKPLITQILAWIKKSEAKHGKELVYAADIGDRLARNDLKDEAKQWWQSHVNMDPESTENRYLAERLLGLVEKPDQKIPVLQNLLKVNSDQQGAYSSWLADIYYKKKDYGKMEQVLKQARQRKDSIPFSKWTLGDSPTLSWVDGMRADKEADDATKAKIFNMVSNVDALGASAPAKLALLELEAAQKLPIMQRLKTYREATLKVSNHIHHFDRLMSYAQAAQGRKDYAGSAALLTNMPSGGNMIINWYFGTLF